MSKDWTQILDELETPFEPALVQFRVGATTRDGTKAQALPYVDPREYERRLDAVVPGGWGVTFEPWESNGATVRLICNLSIHGVTRASTGEAKEEDKAIAVGTAAEAQAFKRACSKFGLGRHLYDDDAEWLPYDKDKRRFLQTPVYRPKSTANQNRSNQPTQNRQAQTPKQPTKQANGQGSERDMPDFEPNTRPQGKPTLTRQEADTLYKAMFDNYGAWIDPSEFTQIAGRVLGRQINDLAQLYRGEGNEVLKAARDLAAERK